MHAFLRPVLWAAVAALATPSIAQDLSDDEFRALVQEQLQIRTPTRSLGNTRTVDVILLDEEDNIVAAPEAAGGTVQAAAEAAPPGSGGEEYLLLDPEQAINILIQFDFDSAVIRASETSKIAQICRIMQEVPEVRFLVAGHTDTRGTEEYNKVLSRLRAEEVVRQVVACGIDVGRLRPAGLGESFPLENRPPEADENRRVEIQVLS